MFMTGVLFTVCGARGYLDRGWIFSLFELSRSIDHITFSHTAA